MYRVASLALSFSLLVAGCNQGGAGGIPSAEPKTEEQKTLYALGLWIAGKVQAFNLKPDELGYVMQGLRDGVSSTKKPLVEMNTYGPKLNELAQARAKGKAEEEKKGGATFLETAAKEAGAEKTPSGLVYKSIKEGTGESPKATDKVKVHYHGTLRDGKVFDSSVERKQPASFPLNGVVPCWTEGVQKMKVGGKAKLTCPAELAYGDQGRPGIPPGAVLTFEVELLEIEAPAAAPPAGMHEMPPLGGQPGIKIAPAPAPAPAKK